MRKTANAVKDGSKMTDEQLGTLTRRFDEIKRRINEGTIPYALAVEKLQRIIEEGKTSGLYVVDLDANPFIPEKWSIVAHYKGGKFNFDPAKIELYIAKGQKNDKSIRGHRLREELKAKRAFNVNLLDFLLANPSLIPEKWKGTYIFFWGTIYHNSVDDLVVRCLFFHGSGWDWTYFRLSEEQIADYAAAVAA